jgi:predicted metal-dependent hydrolase
MARATPPGTAQIPGSPAGSGRRTQGRLRRQVRAVFDECVPISHSGAEEVRPGGANPARMEDKRVTVGGREFVVRTVPTTSRRAAAYLRGNVVTLRIPSSLAAAEAEHICRQLEKQALARLQDEPPPPPAGPQALQFRRGQRTTVMGRTFAVAVRPGAAQSSSAKLIGDLVLITLAEGLSPEEESRHVSVLARRVISRTLLPALQQRVRDLNARHFRFSLGRVSVKDQVSRWGSCSSAGNINLNFRLLLAPPEVMDAVIVHELAHLQEHNHGPGFWKLVYGALPDYDHSRQWLTEHGAELGVEDAGDED